LVPKTSSLKLSPFPTAVKMEMVLLRYWGHDFVLLGSRDVTDHSRDHWTPNMQFPVGSQFEPTVYIEHFSTYQDIAVTTLTVRGHVMSS